MKASVVGGAGGKNAVFTVHEEHQRPFVTLNFLHKNGTQWVPIKVLADTGNDTTLLSKEDGIRLGFNPDVLQGDPVGVRGVGEGTSDFEKFMTQVQIENFPPVAIPISVAAKPGQLSDNLLGREGILNRFNITYTGNSVVFIMKALSGAVKSMEARHFLHMLSARR